MNDNLVYGCMVAWMGATISLDTRCAGGGAKISAGERKPVQAKKTHFG